MSKIGNVLFYIVGVLVILGCFKISTAAGFGFVIGLCVGIIIQKLDYNDIKYKK